MRILGVSVLTILLLLVAYYLGTRNALGMVISAVQGLGS